MLGRGTRSWTSMGSAVLICALIALGSSASEVQALPPGWSYELVSPADTLGADVQNGAGSPDGDHAWISAPIPLSTGALTGNATTTAFTRRSDGWTVRPLAHPTILASETATLEARSTDSRSALVQRCKAALSGCTGELAEEKVNEDGSRITMLTAARLTNIGPPKVLGASDDLSRMVFFIPQNRPALLSEDTHILGRGLYISHNGVLQFLGKDEHGAALPCGADLLQGGTGFQQSGISASGSTVAFISPEPTSECADPTDVYVWRDGETTNASKPRNGEPDEGAKYIGISRDGDATFFISRSHLVVGDADSVADLFRYDRGSDSLLRLTPSVEVDDAVVSPDGDYVYFVSPSTIAGAGVPGTTNLYGLHEQEIRYIGSTPAPIFLSDGFGSDGLSLATPDGTHLLFNAQDSLSGGSGSGNGQIYQYNWKADMLLCVSCHPDGTAPSSTTQIPIPSPAGNYDHRLQSDDGRTIIFDSTEPLVPADVNGRRDAYLWRDGSLSLLAGQTPFGSQVVSTNIAGDSAFFTTKARLVPGVDQDNGKLYQARLGGGFPFAGAPAVCLDDACQGPLPSVGVPGFKLGGSDSLVGSKRRGGRGSRAATNVKFVKLGERAGERAAEQGVFVLRLITDAEAAVRLRLDALVGGTASPVARTRETPNPQGRVRVAIKLPRVAREQLATSGRLRLQMVASQAGHRQTHSATLRVRI